MALTCPNVNMPEWKTLESAVGKMEAYRDYMETDGLIRTPEDVKLKLDTRKTSINYQLTDPSVMGEPIGREIVSNMLDILKSKFDMEKQLLLLIQHTLHLILHYMSLGISF